MADGNSNVSGWTAPTLVRLGTLSEMTLNDNEGGLGTVRDKEDLYEESNDV